MGGHERDNNSNNEMTREGASKNMEGEKKWHFFFLSHVVCHGGLEVPLGVRLGADLRGELHEGHGGARRDARASALHVRGEQLRWIERGGSEGQ